jgi:hypothetical protein
VRRVGGKWVIGQLGSEPLARLLGVDTLKHCLFGYDAAARGIRLYSYNVQAKTWTSSLIATGLGAAGDMGVCDATSGTLYSTHETADDALPRSASMLTTSDVTGIGLLKAWPLVATSWNGNIWTSRVLAETGVPQQPAVFTVNHRVFFALRYEPETLHYYQPARGKAPEYFGVIHGWSGQDTWDDNDSYTIKVPQYPSGWLGFGLEITYTLSGNSSYWNQPWIVSPYHVTLKGPISVVPYYSPVFTDTALPPRLAGFRVAINSRQGRLVQHWDRYEGEVLRQQTGTSLAGYLYRDANGVVVTSGSNYPKLDIHFDPANPPANFAALSDPNVTFFASSDNVVADPTLAHTPASKDVPSNSTLDAAAPFAPAQLRLPAFVASRTFGHRYTLPTVNQIGARYRHYSNYGTNYAMPSGIAVDNASGVTFYTQAAPPSESESWAPFVADTLPPLSGFRVMPDPKWQRTDTPRVWIVMVY